MNQTAENKQDQVISFVKDVVSCGKKSHEIHTNLVNFVLTLPDDKVKTKLFEFINELDVVNDKQLESVTNFLDFLQNQ